MRIDSNSYADSLIFRYSRTLQAINAGMPNRFDAVLADVNRRTQNAERDHLITETSQSFSRLRESSGRDELIADTARKLSQAVDISGRYDTVLSAYTRNGGAVCV